MLCPFCKGENQDDAITCNHCGSIIVVDQPRGTTPAQSQITIPAKSRVTAAVLAIFLGGIGIHKFYLGTWGLGILYVLFFWTGIPTILGLVEGIRYLILSDDDFRRKASVLRGPLDFLW